MNEKLNVRFLAFLLVSAAVLVSGWTAVHAIQVNRNTGSLLARADAAREAGLTDREMRLVGLYLEGRPDDVDARERYGRIVDGRAKLPADRRKVIAVYEKVVEQDPSRAEVRRRIVELALESGYVDVAMRHLDALRKTFPRDAELAVQLGQCREARTDYAAAAALYAEAVKLRPANLVASLRLANVLQNRLGKASEADAALDAMVAANKGDFHAYLARARTRLESRRADEAERDVAEALRLAPDDIDTHLLAADVAVRLRSKPEVARGHLQFVVERRPDNPRVYEAMAAVELSDGKTDAALACLRRGLEHIPNHPNLLWNEANLLISNDRVDEAKPVVEKIPAGSLPFGRLEFLRANVLVRDGRWRDAVDALEAIRPALSSEPDLAIQADLLLGRCLRTIGDDDRAVLVYRRAIETDVTNPRARFGIVLAILSQGRPDAALNECEQLMQMPVAPASGWALLGRLLILQNLRQPPAQRRWERVDSVLDRAEKSQPGSPLVVILKAEAEVGRGRTLEARRLLEAARDKSPRDTDYWVALAELADRAKDRAGADAVLDAAGKQLGDVVELRLARARHLANQENDSTFRAVAGLADGADRFSPADRARLFGGLADVLSSGGRVIEALALWKKVAELEPRTLSVCLVIFDLAVRTRDDALMGETLDATRQIEGQDGPLSRYNQARRILVNAKKGDRTAASNARALLVEVANKRPAWSRVPLAIAQTYELEGSPDKAIEHYRKAIELGERQLVVVRQLVEMLVERGRYVDADQVIRKLPAQTPVFANLQRLAAEVSLQTNDSSRALDYALKAVPDDSKEPGDLRWLGQVLWANHQNERAERALRRAVELAETDPSGWVALVQFYARTRQKDKATETIARAESRIDKAVAPLALAQCYVSVGKLDQARELFNAARKARPDDVTVLQSVADFALRTGKRDEAKAVLRKIISLQSKDPAAAEQAQKLLAVVLATGGDYQESREALALIGVMQSSDEHPATASGDDVDQVRTRAVVLATQPRKSQQQEAVRILEGLERAGHSLGAEDQFLLAQLYERVGDPTQSRKRMLQLLAIDSENPRYVTYQVRSLLRQHLLNDAQLWLEKLEQLLPDALPEIELKARALCARGQGGEAVELIRTHVRADDPPTVLWVGALLEELGQTDAAEEVFRRYANLAGTADAPLELARFLARRHRVEEALHLCEQARDPAGAEAFGYACLAVLRAGKADDGACQRVEGWLEQAVRKNPKALGLVVCQADLNDLRRRYAQAEALYRQVLQHDPRNLVALNNLAWQLALREGMAPEALSFAERALQFWGPQPALLDTRALAFLANQKPALALNDLDDAALPTLDRAMLASIRFHQARAYLLDDKRPQALKALREARDAGLEEGDLHPLELPAYRELAALR
jgi:tetratricopeptide (TPR) repeat protein